MPRIRGLNNTPISGDSVIFEEISLNELIELHSNNRLGFDRTSFYYLNNSLHSILLSNQANRILLEETRRAISEINRLVEEERLRWVSRAPNITMDNIRSTFRDVMFNTSNHIINPDRISIDNLPTDDSIKKSLLNVPEIGDRVSCQDSEGIFEGYIIEKVGKTLFTVQRDDGQTWNYTTIEITVLNKALKIGDRVRIKYPQQNKYYRQGLGNVTSECIGIVNSIRDIFNTRTQVTPDSTKLFNSADPGIQNVLINWNGNAFNWSGYNDELLLVEDKIEEETEEMKERAKLPLNNPEIVLKHEKLGNLKRFFNKDTYDAIYGYNFNKKILKYTDNILKNDKLYFKFEVIDIEDYREALKSSVKTSFYDTYFPIMTPDGKIVSSSKKEPKKEEIKQLTIEDIKDIERDIISTCIVKINKYIDSSEMFGYKPTKRDMVGSYNKIVNIDYNHYNKDTNSNIAIVIINNPILGKDLKFLLSDVELIQPDPTLWLKSYNTPKDKTIRVSSSVRVVNDKYGSVTKGEQLKVIKIDSEKYILNISPKPPTISRRRNREEEIVEDIIHDESESALTRLTRGMQRTTTPGIRWSTGIDIERDEETIRSTQSIRPKKYNRSKVNPNCPVWCLNNKGKEVKVKLKQIKVI